MKRARRQQGKGAFDLIEEATHTLRTAPAATLAVYYLGAIPFVLGLLYFWADMSRSPFANSHLAEAALGVSALFLWMKFWQAIFARRIRAQFAGEPPPQLNFHRCVRIFLTQTILQPLGFFIIPLAILPLIPFAWIYAFFQNATALAAADGTASKLFNKSWKQAALWPIQNILTLAIMLAFGFCVLLNWTTACLVLPELFKMLFGIESAYSKSPFAMLNTTFFAGMVGLTYLCVDPILKAIYALRCFYGESLQSGKDLKAELKSFAISPQKLTAILVICLTFFLASPSKSESVTSPVAPPANQNISPSDLDHAISQTIHESKYVWRMPREQVEDSDSQKGVIAKFFDKVGAMFRKWAREASDWLQKLLRNLFSNRQTYSSGTESSGYGWIMSEEVLLYTLGAVVLAALALFLYRVWRGRQVLPTVVVQAILPVPDIADENVRADQLPEDGWTKLAREFLERGEFRLAMRAFYLASLSHLAARNLIGIALFKSNREYERELRRRAHSFPDLLSVFGDNIFAFERIWYGKHEVNRELVDQFATNVEKIKGAG